MTRSGVRKWGRRASAASGAFGLLCATALGGLVATSGEASAASSGSTFSAALQTENSTFNPFTAFLDGDLQVINAIYPSLVWNSQANQPVGYLAKSWTISSNKLAWTFHLRSGLKWSNGTPLTADDVAWTLNLVRKNTAAGTANGSLMADVTDVTAPNVSTVVVTTSKPQANLTTAGAADIPIVPESVWKSHVKGLASFSNTKAPVVGYGPYTLGTYKPDQYVTLNASSDFFAGKSKYKTVVLNYYKTSDAEVAALRSGAIDQADNLTATEFNSLKKASGITAYQQLSNTWVAIEINGDARTKSGKHFGNGNPILADQKVRQAIAMSINRPELVQKVWDGDAQPGAGYLTPAFPQWKWTPSASEAQSYDQSKANRMLTAAGYPMGKNGYRVDKKTGKELSFRLGIHSDETNDGLLAPYLVGWMKDIGIKLTIDSMSTTQLNDDLAKGDWDILTDSWGTGADPSYLLSIQTCGVLPTSPTATGNTDSFFCNPTYDKLYNEQTQEFSQSQRVAQVKQMQQILYRADYDIILAYPNALSAVRTTNAKGFLYGTPNAKGYYPLQNEWLDGPQSWLNAVPPSSGSSGSSNTGLIIGIIVAVVVIVGGGGFLLMRRRTAADRE